MPYCKYCGSVVDSDAIFCSECGKRIAAKAPQAKEVAKEPEREETTTARGGTINAEDVLRSDPERVQAYMDRVARYRMSMAMLNQFYNQKEEWDEYDLQMWAEMEEVMRKKYEISEISIFRLLQPERKEKVEPQPERRRNRSYNKKNTEYWEKFEKKKSESDGAK